MKYEQKTFTVPASAGNADYCIENGHTMPDARGRCLRCGSRTTTEAYRARLTATPCCDPEPPEAA